jgi:hypothetical protein
MNMKTNNEWYPYKEFGSYFKLEKGTLMQCAMNGDGTREANPNEVEYLDEDMKRVSQELQDKE